MSLRILWHSNAPWAQSGYGVQTGMFAPRIKRLGHDLAISAFWGLEGSPQAWGDIRVYPADSLYGNITLPMWTADHGGGDIRSVQVITLMDVWPLLEGRKNLLQQMRIASWVPVDHDPVPPKVRAFFDLTGAKPIAMSKFGKRVLENAELEPLYVPHGVETDVYKPSDATEFREQIGVPADAFLVGMVANNAGSTPPRKAFPQAFEAFANLRMRHTDAFLYVHSEQYAMPHVDGLNLIQLAHACGLPEDSIRWTPPLAYRAGIPPEIMAKMYSGFDVLLNPAYGEGFGIPVLEAQACGTPVIVNDWTAMPELTGAGWLTEGERFYHPSQGSFFRVPSIASITICLEDAYDKAAAMGDRAREFALAYDADKVMAEHWVPVLDALEEAIEAEQAVPEVKLNRAARRERDRKKVA